MISPTTCATEQGLEPVAVIDPDCTLSVRLELGDTDPEVACLESQLIAAGALSGVAPDEVFDDATDGAVRTFQAANGLVVDGVVGPQTATLLGSWVGPDVLPPDPTPARHPGASAVVDRFNQRSWLCEPGEITDVMPITSAISQPDPGTYEVYAKDLDASSTLTGEYSDDDPLRRVHLRQVPGCPHRVPQRPEVRERRLRATARQRRHPASCTATRRAASESCPEHAELIWKWLDIGDTVIVVT